MQTGIYKYCPIGKDWLRPELSTKVVTEGVVPTARSIDLLKRNDCWTAKRFHVHRCDDGLTSSCEWATNKMSSGIF